MVEKKKKLDVRKGSKRGAATPQSTARTKGKSSPASSKASPKAKVSGTDGKKKNGKSSPGKKSVSPKSSDGEWSGFEEVGSIGSLDLGSPGSLLGDAFSPVGGVQDEGLSKLDENGRVVFELFQRLGGARLNSTISIQELRKSLRKNRKVIEFIHQNAFLEPFLTPRLFHNSIKAVKKAQENKLTFLEFVELSKELQKRHLADVQSLDLFAALTSNQASELTISHLPYSCYRNDQARSYLLAREENAKSGPGMLEMNPILSVLRPKTFKRGLEIYLEENERIEPGTTLEEFDFLALMSHVVEVWHEFVEHRRDFPPVSGPAETFSELAMDAAREGSYAKAASLQEQSVLIRPYDKVYRLALAEYYTKLRRYDEALDEAEEAMQLSDWFWNPACDRARSLKALLDAKIAAEAAEKERSNELELESPGPPPPMTEAT